MRAWFFGNPAFSKLHVSLWRIINDRSSSTNPIPQPWALFIDPDRAHTKLTAASASVGIEPASDCLVASVPCVRRRCKAPATSSKDGEVSSPGNVHLETICSEATIRTLRRRPRLYASRFLTSTYLKNVSARPSTWPQPSHTDAWRCVGFPPFRVIGQFFLLVAFGRIKAADAAAWYRSTQGRFLTVIQPRTRADLLHIHTKVNPGLLLRGRSQFSEEAGGQGAVAAPSMSGFGQGTQEPYAYGMCGSYNAFFSA